PQPAHSLVYSGSSNLIPLPFPYQLQQVTPSSLPVFTPRLSMPSSYPTPATLYHSVMGGAELISQTAQQSQPYQSYQPPQLQYSYSSSQVVNPQSLMNSQFLYDPPQINPFLRYGSIHV